MKESLKKESSYLYQLNSKSNNNVTDKKKQGSSTEEPYFKGVSTCGRWLHEWENNDTFPTFLSEFTTITIPRGIKRKVEKLPKKVLYSIDSDKRVAVEKCLLIASNLTSTLFMDEEDSWKSLSSSILHEETRKGRDNTYIYPSVIEALKYKTNRTNSIIEVKKNYRGTETYEEGVISKQYRYADESRTKNLVSYELSNSDVLNNRKRFMYNLLRLAINNPIGKNLVSVYENISIPKHEEIIKKGIQLSKEKFRTKKGKLLTYQNSKSKDFFSDNQDRSFVEESMKHFNYLTSKGYMIPIIGNLNSGGRVYDSFSLMPSWIRLMCKIGNEEIIELDFSALHPNITLSIFKGQTKFLLHEEVAIDLGKDLKEVKIEHLSFFNKHPNDMLGSVLYEYYKEKEPVMLENILNLKRENGYKYTSRLLFKKEVEIMTACIRILNELGVYVLYVYDALYCKKSEAKVTKEVMNRVVIEKGVYTRVK